MANYTDGTAVEAATNGKVLAASVQKDWLDGIDDLLDQHTGISFKGATHTIVKVGTGTELTRLPSPAQSITSITQEGPDGSPVLLAEGVEYRFDAGSRFVLRK